jgi:hypothetical protein
MHEMTDDGFGPGLRVESTDDDVPDLVDYTFELTVATQD